ncbi:MAG: phosphatase PAP2 family protein [Deltaproteobacteria bacterium]
METIWNIGISWNIFFQNLGSFLKMPMEVFSFFGTENFFLLLIPALYWCIAASIGLRVGIILLLSASVNDALKIVLHGPRPYWYSTDVIRYASETTFGVPSGHAQIAFGVWGMLAASIGKWWGWLIAILIILLIGISRLYLGVHFPHDVILGWLIGALLLWLVLRFWKPVTAWLKKMSLGQQILASFLSSLLLIAFSLIPFFWLKITNWQLPPAWAEYAKDAVSLNAAFTTAGMLFGLLTGLAWFNTQGGFDASGSLWKRILRYILGMVGVLVLYLGLKVLFGLIAPSTEAVLPYILRYIRYVLVGAWISAGAPWIFIKLNLANKAA